MSNQQEGRAKNYRTNQGIQQAQKKGKKGISTLCEPPFSKERVSEIICQKLETELDEFNEMMAILKTFQNI